VAAASATYQFHVTSPVAEKVDLSLKPLSIALAVFGFVAALAVLVIASKVLSRQHRDLEDEQMVVRALGASTKTIMAEGLVSDLAAIVPGSLLAVVVAVALSPLSPLGPVRPVYPGPWFAFDWTVLGGGLIILVIALSAVAVGLAYRGAPHRVARHARRVPAPQSRVASATATAGLPVAAAVGVRFALERQAALPNEEQKQVYADYQGINQTPGVTPGLPMGLPQNATSVRIEGGKTLTTDGPFVGMKEAVGGWFILEADDLDAAIEVAARVPAARYVGAVEIPPSEVYW
jgi:hypothetical protein